MNTYSVKYCRCSQEQAHRTQRAPDEHRTKKSKRTHRFARKACASPYCLQQPRVFELVTRTTIKKYVQVPISSLFSHRCNEADDKAHVGEMNRLKKGSMKRKTSRCCGLWFCREKATILLNNPIVRIQVIIIPHARCTRRWLFYSLRKQSARSRKKRHHEWS